MKILKYVAIIGFIACSSNGVPSGILPPSEMKFVMLDMMQADEYANNFLKKDSLVAPKVKNIQLYEQVFKIHNISKDEFYKSYEYYQFHPDKNKILFDSLAAYASRKREQLSKEKLAKDSIK